MTRPTQSWFTKAFNELDREHRIRKSREAVEAQWEADVEEDRLTEEAKGDPLLKRRAA